MPEAEDKRPIEDTIVPDGPFLTISAKEWREAINDPRRRPFADMARRYWAKAQAASRDSQHERNPDA